MNKGTEILKDLLQSIKKMTVDEYNLIYEALKKEDNEELYKRIDDFFERVSSKAVVQNFENMDCELEDIKDDNN